MAERYFRVVKLHSSDESERVKVGDVAKQDPRDDSDTGITLINPGWWLSPSLYFYSTQVEEVDEPKPIDISLSNLSPCYEASKIMKAMLCTDDCRCPRCLAAQGWIAAFPVKS